MIKITLDKLSLYTKALRQLMILLGEKFTIILLLYNISYTCQLIRQTILTGIIMSKSLDFYTNLHRYLFCNLCNEM